MVAQSTGQEGLALFDFDGTLTSRDTFTGFIHFAVPRWRVLVGTLLLAPWILAYRKGWLSARKIREKILFWGFWGRRAAAVQRAGKLYAREHLEPALRSRALERLRFHRERGDTVVVVSASLDVYLRDFCDRYGVELIANRLEAKHGILTGRYADGDCSGEAKAKRVRQRYDVSRFEVICAYGDTRDDEAMLSLATERYYRWQGLGD